MTVLLLIDNLRTVNTESLFLIMSANDLTVYKMFCAIDQKSELLHFVSTLFDVMCSGVYCEDATLIC